MMKSTNNGSYKRLSNVSRMLRKAIIKKVSAFTLMELVVTFLISSLVVLAAFQVIGSFTGISIQTVRSNEKYTNRLQFYKSISHDMQLSQKLVHYDDETIFTLHDNTLVSYKLDQDCMVRTVNEVSDTFRVVITNWHLIKDKNTQLPVALELEIENTEHEMETYRVTKSYGNDEFLNASELKNN